MFPRISDLLNYLLGTNLDIPIQSYGFLVALAFVVAALVLYLELKRKEKVGQIASQQKKILKGGPVSFQELFFSSLFGFLLGWKGVGLILDYSVFSQNPQDYILSGEGSLLAGIVLAAAFAGYGYSKKRKERLEKPVWVEVTVHPYQLTGNILLVAAIFGLIGSKIFDTIEHLQDLFQDPVGNLFSFSGLSFYGGLIVAAVTVVWYAKKHGIRFPHIADTVAPALILAYAVGRIGCQLSGDGCWGVENPHPMPNWLRFLPEWVWRFQYPHNVIDDGVPIPDCTVSHCFVLPAPVYPTPLYETLMGLVIFAILWSIRKKLKTPGYLFSVYLILNGFERFLIEQIRINKPYDLFGMKLTQAEGIAMVLMLLGAVGFWYFTIHDSRKTMINLEQLTFSVCRLCEETGEFIRQEAHRFKQSDIREKSPANFVTYVDEQAEQRLMEGLSRLIPGSGFIAEESRPIPAGEFTWIIDPLDGTTNYIHGIPLYSISVALMKGDVIVSGVVYEARQNELFFTWEKAPSHLNGRVIRVSETCLISDGLFATGFPYYDYSRLNEYMEFFKFLMQHSRGVRRLGSAAADLAYVACGRFDGFYEYGLSPWDVAAGSLLVRNAGGNVCDFKGGEHFLFGKELIATNQNVHQLFLENFGDYF
ncbi:MAG: inositol monophosphatase family protein [bacterium]